MSRQVEQLPPAGGKQLTVYSCGLTVYSQPHIGNWVAYVYSDVLVRTLIHSGYNVLRTQNITDVGHLVSDSDAGEDKMEKGARAEGLTAWEVAAKYSRIAEHEAYDLLGLLRPDNLVAATSLIDEQITFARELDEKGYLYKTSDGMYFDTSKVSDYGALARLDIAGLKAGSRVDMAGKKNSTDFAVWKFSPVDSKRDMEWPSPWGVGFPGWHLECSVIARQTLGDQIDIHTGGIDHIPVHHTNEIAQTEALTDKQFVRYWFHNNHMKINGSKLSKSLGNSYTLQDLMDKGYTIDAFKLLVLSSHYRTEGNFTWDILESASNRLANWRGYAALRHQTHDTIRDDSRKSSDEDTVSLLASKHAFVAALLEDINTPAALAIVDEAFSRLDRVSLSSIHRQSLVQLLQTIYDLLGLDLMASTPDISDDAKRIILERRRAREEGDWATSDRLRDELLELGVTVRDTPSGTIWGYQ